VQLNGNLHCALDEHIKISYGDCQKGKGKEVGLV